MVENYIIISIPLILLSILINNIPSSGWIEECEASNNSIELTQMSGTQDRETFNQALKIFYQKGGDRGKGVSLEHFGVRKDVNSDATSAAGKEIKARREHKHRFRKERHDLMSSLGDGASFMMMTTTDDATSDVIHFDLGKGHSRKFNISEDGGSIRFKISGMYVVKFEGTILSETDYAELEFVKSPKFNKLSKPFAKFNIGSGEVNRSTILKFEENDELKVVIRASNGSPVAIGSGTSMLLYKVENPN